MAYLTPSDAPTPYECRRFNIPNSPEWSAIFYGALSELLFAYNWEAHGSLSVLDCIGIVSGILAEMQSNECSDPGDPVVIEDGEGVLRLGAAGHAEQWREGEWQEPNGVYEQPPIPPRTEPTESERICLAAVNAVAVYAAVYEMVTDAATDFEFLDEFLDAVFSGIGSLVGEFAGETAKSFAQLGRQFASQFFFLWEEVTEDYWDTEFEDAFICILREHATLHDDDSVTFDYNGVREALTSWSLELISLNRFILVQQLDYLFYFCAGADGLNAAGGTTAIDSYDCDYCDCLLYEDTMDGAAGAKTFPVDHGGIGTPWGTTSPAGSWQSSGGRTGGGCWNSANIGNFGSPSVAKRVSQVIIDLGAEYTVNSFSIWAVLTGSSSGCRINYFSAAGAQLLNNTPSNVTSSWSNKTYTAPVSGVRYISFWVEANNSAVSAMFLDDVLVDYCP